jgi:two-component system sensor histidine kinase DctS
MADLVSHSGYHRVMTNTPAPQDTRTAGWLWLLPRLAFLLFIATVLGLLWLSQKADTDEQRATLISDMLWLEQTLRFQLAHNEELLGQIAPDQATEATVFESRARVVIGNQTGLRQVRWLDEAGTPRFELPASPRISADEPTLTLARSLGRPIYGSAYVHSKDDWWFDVYVPVFRQGQIAGFVVGAYSLRRTLDDCIPWWLAERYRIVVIDTDGKTMASRSKVEAPAGEGSYQLDFDPPGRGLSLQATPYRSPAPLAGRLLSAALVFLAAVLLWSLWALRRHDHRRLAAEQALREEHAFRKAMGDSLQTGLRARDLEGRITYVNPAFCYMVGWKEEELVGRSPPMPYWVEEEIDTTRALHDRILAGEGPDRGFEIHLKRHDGEIFPALIHEAPLIDADGRQTGWMSSVIDISDQKRTDELARQQQERLQATARLVTMGEMASSLAHELNQPLAAIASYNAGCLNQLTSGAADIDGIEAALVKSTEQAQRAGRIIRRIYEFVRRSEPKSEPCDIARLLDETVALVDGDVRRSGIHLLSECGPSLPIEGDRVLLGQVFLNLIRNAMEALRNTPVENRRIALTVVAVDGQIQVRFADTGVGITPEIAGRLFEPFFTTKPEGMGMGLNICRSIVEAHHGRLWYEPNLDGGSIFYVLLPTDRI